MNGKQSKKLRKIANMITQGQSVDELEKVYKQLKYVHKNKKKK